MYSLLLRSLFMSFVLFSSVRSFFRPSCISLYVLSFFRSGVSFALFCLCVGYDLLMYLFHVYVFRSLRLSFSRNSVSCFWCVCGFFLHVCIYVCSFVIYVCLSVLISLVLSLFSSLIIYLVRCFFLYVVMSFCL